MYIKIRYTSLRHKKQIVYIIFHQDVIAFAKSIMRCHTIKYKIKCAYIKKLSKALILHFF